jgi:hypothetical protein
MEAHPSAKPDPTPFQRFDAFTQRVMSVPKSEIDRRAVEDKKRRQENKRVKPR